MEDRVGAKGYIHGWVYVGLHPTVGQSVTDPKTGNKGVIASISAKGVHVNWQGDDKHPLVHGGSSTPKHAELMNKSEDAKKAGKPSMGTYYKKQAAQHGEEVTEAKKEEPKVPDEDPWSADYEEPKAPVKQAVAKLPENSLYHSAISGPFSLQHKMALENYNKSKAAGKPSSMTYYKKKALAAQKATNDFNAQKAKIAENGGGAKKWEPSFEGKKTEAKLTETPAAFTVGNYLPTNFDEMEKIDGPHGSQHGQWYRDKQGREYYVKVGGDPATEVSGAKVYAALGLKPNLSIPRTEVTPGGKGLISKKIPGLKRLTKEQWADEDKQEKVRKFFAAAVLTSHYDAAGMGLDNMLWDSQTNEPVLVDLGGTLSRRAQGGAKLSWNVHNDLQDEIDSISGTGKVPNSQLKALFGGMSDSEKADELDAAYAKLTPLLESGELKQQFMDAGASQFQASTDANVLAYRVKQIPAISKALRANDSLKADVPSDKKLDDKKLADLQAKYEAAKAAKKPSSASYYKKKIASYQNTVDSKAMPTSTGIPQGSPNTSASIQPANKTQHGHHIVADPEADAGPVDKFIAAHIKEDPRVVTPAWMNPSKLNASKNLAGGPRSSVTRYTGSYYSKVNAALRGLDHKDMDPTMKTHIRNIDRAFDATPTTAVAFKTFRHTGTTETYNNVKPGDVIADPGIQSTTITRARFGGGYNRTTLVIHVPEGAHAIWAKPISSNKHEDEVILPRGQKYVVLEAPEHNGMNTELHVMALPYDITSHDTRQANATATHPHNLH